MLALIIIAHPSPSSLSHAMAAVAEKSLLSRGYSVAMHDLHAERFDPVQPTGESANTASADALVEQHCSELARADLIVVCHPNWWGQPPAILKGWIDRVFRLNTAYAYPAGVGYEGVPVGLLRARHALVFNTSNTPHAREMAIFGDPLQALWKRCVFGLCGVSQVTRRIYAPVATSTAEQRAAWLAEVAADVERAADADESASATTAELGFGRTTPILRIFDEAKAREFYVDFLGFQVDWVHRFEPGLPLYMQVSRDGCVLHLSEHHGDGSPGAAMRIEAGDVDAYQAELASRRYGYARPEAEDMPWGTRDLSVRDPFGNRLTFTMPLGTG